MSRIPHYLSDLEIEIIKNKMIEHGMEPDKDLNKYIQKTISYNIESSNFSGCEHFQCKVKKKQLKSNFNKRKYEFLVSLANKNSTTLSSAIATLLVNGFPKQ